jgi:hypothetical protein
MGVGRLTLNALWWSSLKRSWPSNLFSLLRFVRSSQIPQIIKSDPTDKLIMARYISRNNDLNVNHDTFPGIMTWRSITIGIQESRYLSYYTPHCNIPSWNNDPSSTQPKIQVAPGRSTTQRKQKKSTKILPGRTLSYQVVVRHRLWTVSSFFLPAIPGIRSTLQVYFSRWSLWSTCSSRLIIGTSHDDGNEKMFTYFAICIKSSVPFTSLVDVLLHAACLSGLCMLLSCWINSTSSVTFSRSQQRARERAK